MEPPLYRPPPLLDQFISMYNRPMTLLTLVLALGTVLFGSLDVSAQGREREYTGMCDASAAISLSDSLFAVADDEVNVIRIYSLDSPGAPVAIAPLFPIESPDSSKEKKKKGKKKVKVPEGATIPAPVIAGGEVSSPTTAEQILKATKRLPEIDLEAAARIDTMIFWVGSHGRNASGEEDLHRRQIFFSEILAEKNPSSALPLPSLKPILPPYTRLLDDLIAAPPLKRLRLEQAARLAPKEPGGFNIEAFGTTSDDRALIGLRNPLYNERAIVIPMKNPRAMIEGRSSTVLPPIYLDLSARGIKDLVMIGSTAYIIAGAPDSSARGALFEWKDTTRSTEVRLMLDLASTGINAEAILPLAGGRNLLLLSDDGKEIIEGKECKKLKDSSKKKFRTVEISLPPHLQ